jgi:hypothetical protein
MRKTALVVTIIGSFLACAFSSQAQMPNMIGSWKVEVTLGTGEKHSLRFHAGEAGKGSFQLAASEALRGGSDEPSAAQWTRQGNDSVTLSGAVQFPLGNVGIDRGTLVLKGKFERDGSLSGEARFFPAGQNPADPKATPSKTGSFKAVRTGS